MSLGDECLKHGSGKEGAKNGGRLEVSLVAVRTPGLRVRARGVGKTASKLVWLFRKLAGPVNVKIGVAPRIHRRSLYQMVGGAGGAGV